MTPALRGTFARAVLASMAVAFLTGCAVRRQTPKDPDACEFTVKNQTAWGMDIRLVKEESGGLIQSSGTIGAVNGGESLTHSVPCAQRFVWVRGVPIPSQVGWPTGFAFTDARVDLVPGQRVSVALHWP